jgi:pyruvate,orthophosphate dikinase
LLPPASNGNADPNTNGSASDAGRSSVRAASLAEARPLLGHRGCRFLIAYPEIVELQARAILEAAAETGAATGRLVEPEIIVPQVMMRSELDHVRAAIETTARQVKANGHAVTYRIGTTIEVPRAALRAEEIAAAADFFSFATGSLTETTYGLSWKDAAGTIGAYQDLGLIDSDPFATIDADGVGALIRIGAGNGRKAKPDLRLGLCGEHGADPASIRFFDAAGLDYVSCPAARVPVARLAAAQAALATAQARGA